MFSRTRELRKSMIEIGKRNRRRKQAEKVKMERSRGHKKSPGGLTAIWAYRLPGGTTPRIHPQPPGGIQYANKMFVIKLPSSFGQK